MTEIIKKKHRFIGSAAPNWKGGRVFNGRYWTIYKPDHPFANKHGCVLEHRLRLEEYLDRYLLPEEEVHHLDLNKENNRIGNLMWFSNQAEHKSYERTGNAYAVKNKFNRYCLSCGGKTYVRKNTGYEQWHRHENEFICEKCYQILKKDI